MFPAFWTNESVPSKSVHGYIHWEDPTEDTMGQGLWRCLRHKTEEAHLAVLSKDQKSFPEGCRYCQGYRMLRTSSDCWHTHLDQMGEGEKRKGMRGDQLSFPLQKPKTGLQEHLTVYQLLQVLPQRSVSELEFESLPGTEFDNGNAGILRFVHFVLISIFTLPARLFQ